MSETFYITKYCLTTGIQKEECCDVFDERYASRGRVGMAGSVFAKIGTHAFRTEEEAKARVAAAVKAKLKSIDKQIARLKKIALDNS